MQYRDRPDSSRFRDSQIPTLDQIPRRDLLSNVVVVEVVEVIPERPASTWAQILFYLAEQHRMRASDFAVVEMSLRQES